MCEHFTTLRYSNDIAMMRVFIFGKYSDIAINKNELKSYKDKDKLFEAIRSEIKPAYYRDEYYYHITINDYDDGIVKININIIGCNYESSKTFNVTKYDDYIEYDNGGCLDTISNEEYDNCDVEILILVYTYFEKVSNELVDHVIELIKN